MQRILILTYFFPPCNLTASQRVFSWAHYLHEFGYYPIVITRRWDREVNHLNDLSFPTPSTVQHVIHDDFEVYYVPYEPNLRDRIFARYGETKFSSTRRLLSFLEVMLQSFFISFIPFRNLYFFAKTFLKKNRDIKILLISGNPFILFKFGYRLQKRFNLQWIADYRDAWSTSEINAVIRNKWWGWINRMERKFEKKWTGSATAITAVSNPILQKIQELTEVSEGFALYNGFVEEEIPRKLQADFYKPFTITYVGTLFNGQPVKIFAEAFRRFVQNKSPEQIQLLFPGIAFYPEQEQRMRDALKGLDGYLHTTSRISRQEILMMEHQSHVLLHFGWSGFRGIIASKIYEYIGTGRPILLCPTDHDVVHETLSGYNLAALCDSADESYCFLEHYYSLYLQGQYHDIKPDVNFQQQFTRRLQVQKLSEVIQHINR